MAKLFLISCAKYLLLGVMLALGGPWAFAQSPAAKSAPTAEIPAVTVLHTLALVRPAQEAIEAVQALPAASWQGFNPRTSYPIKDGLALWVQLKLSVQTPPNGWTIKLPKPYLDRVELYLLSHDSAWTVQAAGDWVAHSAWPVRGLHPQFLLPTLPVGEHAVFLKITNTVPFNTTVELRSAQGSLSDNLEHLVRTAGITILVLCMALISACMAWVYRDTAYAWYSAYALSAALTASAYTGLANYLLWPNAPFWAERSIHVSLLGSIFLQIIFCYITFEPQKLWHRFTALLWFSGFLTFAGMAVLLTEKSVWIYAAGLMVPMVVNWIIVLSMVAVRLRLGELPAKLWTLAYLPLAVLIAVTTLEGFGLLPESISGYYWPLYALAFEVPILLLALMMRAKETDARAVTQRTRQQLDPLTGFVLPRAYKGLAAPMWEKSAALDQDLAVVYVQITQPDLPFLSGRSQAPGSQRIVRVLRTVFRQEDSYAQIRDDVYAVLMPGKTMGEPLQTRLARLVAQLHMLSQELKTDFPLRTRVAACTSRSLPMQWSDVHRILLEKFSTEKNWDKRSILMVARRHSQRADDSDLSDFWARAVEAEASFKGTSHP
jgi:two-component system, sensor histidine kinase LadS